MGSNRSTRAARGAEEPTIGGVFVVVSIRYQIKGVSYCANEIKHVKRYKTSSCSTSNIPIMNTIRHPGPTGGELSVTMMFQDQG